MYKYEAQRNQASPLADTALAGLEPESTPYRELDGGGLYFRVKPNGQKSWNFRYKKPDGKWSWLGLGSYPEVSGSAARQKAAELRGDLADGKNPIVSKQARKAADLMAANSTFEALAREWIEIRVATWAPTTAKRTIGALELHAFPVFGQRLYTEILPIEWMDFFKGMEQKGIIEQMSRVRRSCKEVYDLARVTGRAVHNPIEGLSRFLQSKPAENYAHVTAKELPSLLRAIAAYPHAHDLRLGLRLLMLTGVRPSELREARWDEFDRKAGLWSIPAERMAQHIQGAVLLQLAHQLLHQHAFRVVRVGLGELVPTLRPGLFEVAEKVLGIQRRAPVIAASRAGEPALGDHGSDDVLLELSFLAVRHLYGLCYG